MKALAIGLLATMAHVVAAPHQPYRPHMTGSQLVRDMLADPFEGKMNSVRRERAMGYIDGVMDASAGLRWCPVGTPIPHELNYIVVEDVARMSRDTLKGDASALVLAALARLYPCNRTGAKP